MGLTYAEYEGAQPVHCPHCGWHGTSKELASSEYHPYSNILDLDCPSCHEHVTFVQFPVVSIPYDEKEDREVW